MANSNLGHWAEEGFLNNDNPVTQGAWSVEFKPQVLPSMNFEVWHGVLTGPGGHAIVFLDNTMYGVAQNGRINEYAPSIPMYVMKGQTIWLHWSIGTGSAPTVTFFFRQPEVGRI